MKKTTQELITEIQEEYQYRLQQGEQDYKIKTYNTFSYIQKYFSPDQKATFSREAIFFILEHFKEKRAEIIQNYQEIDSNFYRDLSRYISPFASLIEFCTNLPVKYLQEKDITNLLEFYAHQHTIKLVHPHSRSPFDINHHLLNINLVLRFIVIYQIEQELSQHHIQLLNSLKTQTHIQEYTFLVEGIDDLIHQTGNLAQTYLEKNSRKIIAAQDLASHKKWKWLQGLPHSVY